MSDWLSSNISPPRLGESYFRSPLPTRREVPVVVSIAVTVVYKINAPPVIGAAAEIINQRRNRYYNTSINGAEKKNSLTTQLHKVQQVTIIRRH